MVYWTANWISVVTLHIQQSISVITVQLDKRLPQATCVSILAELGFNLLVDLIARQSDELKHFLGRATGFSHVEVVRSDSCDAMQSAQAEVWLECCERELSDIR